LVHRRPTNGRQRRRLSRDKDIVAVARDRRVLLLDAASLGGGDHDTALRVARSDGNTGTFAPDAAMWQDMESTPLVAVPVTETRFRRGRPTSPARSSP
jgi:hypothetical protein